jgi:diketogulonate reductase-like aldo/keto reductase
LKSLTDTFKLNNGVEIPCIGFGTWQTPNGDAAVSSVKEAIKAGYRHIDTAAAYGNEEGVAQGIKESGVPRKEIFITSKLQNPMHGYENTKAAFEDTMKKLDTAYLDLYLIHWPNPIMFRSNWEEVNAGTWKAFEEFYKAGRIRALGISNFHPHHIEALLKTASVEPSVNQIRLCPGDTQDEVVNYCRKKNILLEAYSPLGTGTIFQAAEIQALAKKYNKTVAQICIRWSLQQGYLPLPKSITPARIEENTKIFDFELSQADVKAVADMKGIIGYSKNPDETAF